MQPEASPQSSQVDYALHTLGWKSFQDLCLTIAAEILGQTVQIFNSSHDGGRDGAFAGTWKQKENIKVNLSGTITFQCKYTSQSHKSLQIKHIEDEFVKAQNLAKKGLCTNYILLTNYSLTATSEAEIRKKYLSISGINECLIFGKEWISQQIRESTRLRMLVPRVYGLGDLSQILDQRVYAQANEILFSLKDTLSKFVMTEPYRESVNALTRHGFVVLIGEPASGKSTIAASLAIAAADQWKSLMVRIVDPHDFITHWNPNENNQFFWIDDAFGATQFQRDRAQAWNLIFPSMAAAIKNGSHIVFTSRDYIFKAAMGMLKFSELPLLQSSQVVIRVQALSKGERAQILYNHIKLGDQIVETRARLKNFLPEIAMHWNFSPEIARRLGNNHFTKKLSLHREAVLDFVAKPKEFLKEIIQTLDSASQACLGLIFMRGGEVEIAFTLTQKEKETLEAMSAMPAAVHQAFRTLNGSFIHTVRKDGSIYWNFMHPTIMDAYSAFIANDPQLLDLYLEKTPIETLVQEITCGDVELEGQKVVVPKDRYPIIAKRLHELKSRDSWIRFLSYRCDKDFLKMYPMDSDMKKSVMNIYPFLHACDEIALLSRFHEFGLLPEEWRKEAIGTIIKLAIDTPDSDFLTLDWIKSLFSEDEIVAAMNRVREELLPSLRDVINDWTSNFPIREDPKSYFGPLESTLEEFKEFFKGDEEMTKQWDRALCLIEDAKTDLIPPDEEDRFRDSTTFGNAIYMGESKRSIFDDVDK